MTEAKETRILYLDAARSFAIVMVALNHAVNRTWVNYGEVAAEFRRLGLPSVWLKALLTVASHLGVPLFLMITGALILSRPFETREEFRLFFRGNWLALLLTSEIWFFLGYWAHVLASPGMLQTKGLDALLFGCVKTLLFIDQLRFDSMWYVPMILSIYVMLPILAVFLHRAPSPRVIPIPMAAVFCAGMLVPALNVYRRLLGSESLSFSIYSSNFFSLYLLYVIAGWQIAGGGMKRLPDAAVWAGAALSFLLCVLLQFFCYSRSAHLIAYESPGILLVSVFLFECFRRFSGCLRRFARPLAAVSRAAFALYLVHVFFLLALSRCMSFSGWPHTAKVLFLTLVPLAASGLFIRLLSHIPWCKKRLFLIK